jgi:hypothetical protein
LNSFLRQTSAVLITIGYSFRDIHLNDAIVSALKANPTAMVIALLHDTYTYQDKNKDIVTRYEKAFAYAKDRFNLSVWTFDEAVIGGQQGKWKVSNTETLPDENLADAIVQFTDTKKTGDPDTKEETIIQYQMQLGNFAKLGNFLQALIGIEQFKITDAK